MKPGWSYLGQAVFYQDPFRHTASIRPLLTIFKYHTICTNPQNHQLHPQVSSAAFFSFYPLSPNPHHQPLLNFIFFHCSDNHCDKSYVSNYNNRLPQCRSSVFLGNRNEICLLESRIRDVSKHRTLKWPWIQMGGLLSGRHSSHKFQTPVLFHRGPPPSLQGIEHG